MVFEPGKPAVLDEIFALDGVCLRIFVAHRFVSPPLARTNRSALCPESRSLYFNLADCHYSVIASARTKATVDIR